MLINKMILIQSNSLLTCLLMQQLKGQLENKSTKDESKQTHT
jgi:hypothetical protein